MARLAEEKASSESAQSGHAEEIAQLRRQLQEQTDNLEQRVKQQIAQLQGELDTAVADKEAITSDKVELAQLLDAALAEKDAAATEKAELAEKLAAVVAEKEAAATERAELAQKLGAAVAEKQTTATEKTDLVQLAESAQREAAEHGERADAAEAKLLELETVGRYRYLEYGSFTPAPAGHAGDGKEG